MLWTLRSSSNTRRSLWAGRLARRAVSLWRWLRTWYKNTESCILKLRWLKDLQPNFVFWCHLSERAAIPELCSEQQQSSCDIPELWSCLRHWLLSLASPAPAADAGPPEAPAEPAQLHSPALWSYGCIACSGLEHLYLELKKNNSNNKKIDLPNTDLHQKKMALKLVPVLTSSLMSSSFIRMVTDSSLIFCCAWRSPNSELPSKLFRLPTRDISSELELAADLRMPI